MAPPAMRAPKGGLAKRRRLAPGSDENVAETSEGADVEKRTTLRTQSSDGGALSSSSSSVRSSRVIVRNIPKVCTESRIKDFFSGSGDGEGRVVTDVRIQRTAKGESRRFCFVGFKSEDEAEDAVRRLHKSFIDTSRLSVQLALPTGHSDLPRPWSAHSFGSSAHKKRHGSMYDNNAGRKNSASDSGNSTEQGAAKKRKLNVEDLLGNDDGDDKKNGPVCAAGNTAGSKLPPATPEEIRALGDTGRLYLVNLPYSVEDEELKQFMEGFGEVAEIVMPRDNRKGSAKGYAFVTYVFPEDAVKAYEALESGGTSEGGAKSNSTGTVMKIFQGRVLQIRPAAPKPEPQKEKDLPAASGKVMGKAKREGGGTSSYKRDLEARQAEAAGRRETWNLLYVSANAATDAMAEALGVGKRELLDVEGGRGSAAVRVALGETHIIQQTKKWLLDEGIDLKAFERVGPNLLTASANHDASSRGGQLSNSTIIAKHLPFKASPDKLRETFSRFGQLSRFCIAPSGTVAVAQFADKRHAAKAFTGLAFRKFETCPLYLEWAPSEIFGKPPPEQTTKENDHP